MNLLITGDFSVMQAYNSGKLIDKRVVELFSQSDFNIVNLEAPVTDSAGKILKTGPHLKAHKESTRAVLKTLNVHLATLANNHIKDYDGKGLLDTIAFCRSNGIDTVGAGINLKAAAKPHTISADGIKIAILNFCENEWSAAEESKPGANPLDIIDNVNQIKEAGRTHDKVMCIIHGGHEYYHLPSPRMVKQYRFYADNGADAIIGHHTHCIDGYEIYRDVPIIYSLGNFLFTLSSVMEVWYAGLLALLNIEKDKPITFDLCPVAQEKNTFSLTLLTNKRKEAMLNWIKGINAVIADRALLQEKWDEFIRQQSDQYLNSLSPVIAVENRYIRGGFNRLGISKLLLSKNFLKTVLNLARCEAHADALKAVIKKHLTSGD